MGMRKNAKKQGNAVVAAAAAAVTDATKDVPVDTATEKVAQKSKKKQGKAVEAVAADATDDVPANAATEKVVSPREGVGKRKNEGECTHDNKAVATTSKKKHKKNSATTAAAAAAGNESGNNDDNLPSARAGNSPTATDDNMFEDGNDDPSNKKLLAKTGGCLSTAEMLLKHAVDDVGKNACDSKRSNKRGVSDDSAQNPVQDQALLFIGLLISELARLPQLMQQRALSKNPTRCLRL